MNQEKIYIHSAVDNNLSSANEIVPVLIKIFQPKSVVDMGCGLGTFLHVFSRNGVDEILGIDGPWVDKTKLLIDSQNFEMHDLGTKVIFNKKFDLVISLEVAEHLPESDADIFLDNLISLGEIIIFSAALKNQGGQNHINEQPFIYWQEKFKKRGFVYYDVFRKRFWNNPNVAWWYSQNMFLVAKESVNIQEYLPGISAVTELDEYIHPDLFAYFYTRYSQFNQQYKKIKSGEMYFSFYLSLIKKRIMRKFFHK